MERDRGALTETPIVRSSGGRRTGTARGFQGLQSKNGLRRRTPSAAHLCEAIPQVRRGLYIIVRNTMTMLIFDNSACDLCLPK